MVKEVKLFETSDGKTFKTKQGAENHEKKIEAAKVMEKLNMTDEQIEEALERTSKYNNTVRMLLNNGNWKEWPKHLIRQINEDLLKEPDKKTIYVRAYRDWGKYKEETIAVETGANFADPEKHCETKDEKYKVVKTEEIDDYTLKVFYDYKYTWEERIKMKLENGVKLEEDEIREMVFGLPEVYEEEGDEGRWERYMTTVVDLLGDHYAINWSRGLTESQDNYFYAQPYRVKVETKEVVVKKTIITAIK